MRQIPFGRPIIQEEEKKAVLEVLSNPILVHGPQAKMFENRFSEFTGAQAAVSASSCTAALHLFYFDMGLKSGDEVIVPAQTHTATAHAVEFTGAKPVFVDAESQTGNIDIEQIESNISEKTKAISVVHYLGMPVDMDRINEVAKKYDLAVLEDCALAIGTYYKGKHAGLIGDAGCYSFYPVKHMTTAEGGMFITKHSDLADRITKKKAFGVNKDHSERKVPGVYDVSMLGYNYRMNEIQAAIGIVQMDRIQGFLETRKENYNRLYKLLSELDEIDLLESSREGFESSYYCMSAILKEEIATKRFEIVEYLKEKGVGTSVYYPKPVPHMSYYKEKYGYSDSSFPNASRISYQSIALPVGPHLNVEDMDYIGQTLKEALSHII